MENKGRSGRSIILLIIVILVMSIAFTFVTKIFTNQFDDDSLKEEAFKLNVYEYSLQVEEYITTMQQNEDFNVEEFNVCGVDLQDVIPSIVETDLSKFKIEQGTLVYIGTSSQEAKWTNEVVI